MQKNIVLWFVIGFLAFFIPSGSVQAATITVNTLLDENGTGASCSLREAITAANTNALFGGCPAGAVGADAIVFQGGLTGTINVSSALPSLTEALTITGPGPAGLTINGTDAFDGFVITTPLALSISSLTLSNFTNAIDSNTGDITLTDVFVTSSGEGATTNVYAAVKVLAGDLTLTRVSLSNNSGYFGGAVAFEPNSAGQILTVSQSTFANNNANGGAGGAIYFSASSNSTHTITGSTFVSNVGNSTGAVFVGSGVGFTSVMNLTNNTFSANQAVFSGGADAVYGFGDSQVNILYNTFSGHNNITAGSTTGIIHAGTNSDITLTNSLIANNPGIGTPRECSAGSGATFNGSNVFSVDTICPGRVADPLNVNPTLASNGGPTQTHALTAGSNMIDFIGVGANCTPGVTADQRGAARANGVNAGDSACEVGAYEFSSTQTPTAVTLTQHQTTRPFNLGLITLIAFLAFCTTIVIFSRRQKLTPTA